MTRKKLTEAEDGFVKGKATSSPPPVPTAQSNNADVAQILQPKRKKPREAMVRFTADLPEDLHYRLNLAAVKSGKTKVELVRELLDAVLPLE